jgi:DNA-binding CsgD family transcriptional regulator
VHSDFSYSLLDALTQGHHLGPGAIQGRDHMSDATRHNPPSLVQTIAFSGPEPQSIELTEPSLLRMALNQMDYGLVVLDTDSAMVQFANGLGRAALPNATEPSDTPPSGTGLRLLHGRVLAQRPCDNDAFRRTLERARAGLRGYLCLGGEAQRSAVAVVPLLSQRNERAAEPLALLGSAVLPAYALLIFAKQQLCDDSTMALFARDRGLTSAEGQVLAQVCKGLRPAQIADNHGVRISTVRTQLRSIRLKTCCETIRDLVQKVSVLPPMARQLSGQWRN